MFQKTILVRKLAYQRKVFASLVTVQLLRCQPMKCYIKFHVCSSLSLIQHCII
jgi:hypothetical protein